MEIAEYQNIYLNEGDQFFYVSTHTLVLSLTKHFQPRKKKLRILDAGCGTGLLTKKMQRFGKVVGIDMSPEALRFAKKRKVQVTQASIEKVPFKNQSFDVVVCIDVLTHASIKNDLIALKEFYRVLKPNGILILRVAAHPWLKLIHDKHVHVNHRYKRQELKDQLTKTGFKIEKLSFIHSLLFPLIIVKHTWENVTKPKEIKSAVVRINPVINSLLTQLLLIEAKLFLKISLPFGLGLVSVG